MEALHHLSDAIFNVKDKLTDAEFKELSDITKDLCGSVKHKAPVPDGDEVLGEGAGVVRIFHDIQKHEKERSLAPERSLPRP